MASAPLTAVAMRPGASDRTPRDPEAAAASPSPAALAEVVERLSGPGARPVRWQTVALGSGSGGNPTTAALLRVHGHATHRAGTTAWSVITKTLTSPRPLDGVDMGTAPGHWNYWRREALLCTSGLLADLPAGLAMPRCLGVETLAPDLVRLWLEDVGHLGARWNTQRYALAARHLGRFNGSFLTRGLPRRPWLRGALLRQWADDFPALIPAFFAGERSDGWAHPTVRRAIPEHRADVLAALLRRRHELLSALDRLPRTLCHGDFSRENLGSRQIPHGTETVAIDWALTGVGVVGEDLGTLALSAWADSGGKAWPRVEHDLVEAYLAGLADVGARAEPTDVRFAMVATAALRYSLYELYRLHRDVDRPVGAARRDRFRHLAGLAERALADLADRVPAALPPAGR